MLKYKGTYEIISPDDIGLTRANEFGIVLGKLRYYATYHPLLTSFSPIFCVMSQLDFSYQLSTFLLLPEFSMHPLTKQPQMLRF